MTRMRIPYQPVRPPATSREQTEPRRPTWDHAPDRSADPETQKPSPPPQRFSPPGDRLWFTKFRKRWDDPVPADLADATHAAPAVESAARDAAPPLRQDTEPGRTSWDHPPDRSADAEDTQKPSPPPPRLPIPRDRLWFTKFRKRWDDPMPADLADATDAPPSTEPAAHHAVAPSAATLRQDAEPGWDYPPDRSADAADTQRTSPPPQRLPIPRDRLWFTKFRKRWDDPMPTDPSSTGEPTAPALSGTAVQLRAAPGGTTTLAASEVHAAAAAGIRDPGEPLPHRERIQRAFGPDHDLSQITAHVGGPATVAAARLGATAYAAGEHVAFASPPDLHLSAHEAAHVVQQRSGVQLQGGLDQPGDVYERHAEAVANAVVDGKAAAALLDPLSDRGAYRSSAQRNSDPVPRTIQRTPVASSGAARAIGSGSPQPSSIDRQLAVDEQREWSIAQHESLRLEAGGAPSVAYYSDLLAAVLAAQRLTDHAPDDPAVSARVTQLLQPVAHRLDQLNDHLGHLRQFGAGNLAGQVALDMSQAAIESWLRRLKLGARIHTDEFVTKFRAGAETLRFLTGERTDAPTLRGFDAASRVTALGAAGLALAPVMVAVAAEVAPLLANAAAIATRRVVLWALHHPAAALAAAEALLGLGVQLGEDGWETFWNQLHDPKGRWFILAQVLMDYMHIRSGTHGGGIAGSSPRRSSVPTGTESPPSRVPAQEPAGLRPDLGSSAAPEVAGARERVTQLRAIVQHVHDDASATPEVDKTAAPPPPSPSNREHSPTAVAASGPHGAARGNSTHNGMAEARESLGTDTTRTAPAAEALVRAMGETREHPPANVLRTRELGLRPQTVRAIKSLESIKKDPIGEANRDPSNNHYKAARREANGEVVARKHDGRPFSHIRDLQEHYQGLENVRRALSAEIEAPPPAITERGLEVLLTKYGEVQSTLSRLKGFLDGIGYGPPYPPFHVWPPGS